MSGPVAQMLDGDRLHLQHGPIDLIIGADGDGRAQALAAAEARFATVLQELVDELPALRAPVGNLATSGMVASRMVAATRSIADRDFVTPMAAVAGAVADEVLMAMRAAGDLTRAYVNNGGDIALWLGRGARFDVALVGLNGQRFATATLTCDHKIGGVATSGCGGRSLTKGIADSVTVLTHNAASADAAATLIANAVDLPDHSGIARQHAVDLDPDSDLGHQLVVRDVPPLSREQRQRALAAGQQRAAGMLARGQISGAAFLLQGETSVVGLPMLTQHSEGNLIDA